LAFKVKTIGKEAHSATPKEGKNAIYDMVHVVNALRELPPGKFKVDDFEAEMPINVATIEGGRAINIIPGECEIVCERRLFPGEDPEKIEKAIRLALERVETAQGEYSFSHPAQAPYAIGRNDEIVSLAERAVSATLGYDPSIRIELGRTDSTYLYHNAGIKTVIAGPGHTGHVKGECIYVDRLLEFTKVLENLLTSESSGMP
jgi:acetylornithine deacetylase/succinyl-diaminopimelate desuccinylase-like protein